MTAEVFKITALCLIATAFCVILRQKGSEYALLVAVAAGVVVMLLVLNKMAQPIKNLSDSIEAYGINASYLKVALKAVGIGYVTDFIADVCRDSGQSSLASKAELAGKTAIFLLSVPLMMSVLETAVEFIK